MQVAAVIVAAGRGVRSGRSQPKQFELLGRKPMLAWSAEAMARAGVQRIVVVIDPDEQARASTILASLPGIAWANGGATRTDSVRSGLEKLRSSPPDAVLIHDAARPGLMPEMVQALVEALRHFDGAAPALPVIDALKSVDGDLVTGDLPRSDLRRVQTPQAFRYQEIASAYAALGPGAALEDDLAVARAAGLRLTLVPGDVRLNKVTLPEDFEAAAHMLAPTAPLIGSGFDAHRFGLGEFVTLCGVRIKHTHGLVGHSDADAPWHALTDAILGAVGLGDIGDHFPPSDIRWRGADSEMFLRHALKLAADAGAAISNADITLLCELPKIKPHREAMRERTAGVLGLPVARVSVKATTTEGLGFLGRGEGLAAQASVLMLGQA